MPFDVARPSIYAMTFGDELHLIGTASIGPLLRFKARNSTQPDTWATSLNTNVREPNSLGRRPSPSPYRRTYREHTPSSQTDYRHQATMSSRT